MLCDVLYGELDRRSVCMPESSDRTANRFANCQSTPTVPDSVRLELDAPTTTASFPSSCAFAAPDQDTIRHSSNRIIHNLRMEHTPVVPFCREWNLRAATLAFSS